MNAIRNTNLSRILFCNSLYKVLELGYYCPGKSQPDYRVAWLYRTFLERSTHISRTSHILTQCFLLVFSTRIKRATDI